MKDLLRSFWSIVKRKVNFIVMANIMGALLLGMLVGYERSCRGRAAGIRTYGLVCMSSCAITVIVGYPNFWYAGHALNLLIASLAPDPTRVIQGIVTGVGFHSAAILLSLLTVVMMYVVGHIEQKLPSRSTISVLIRFRPGYQPNETVLVRVAQERGYKVISGSLHVAFSDKAHEWRYLAIAEDNRHCSSKTVLAGELAAFEAVDKFDISHART